ncbi:MAG: 3-hydroxyacyl-ACP dehydratase FabZ [Candidatus Omnitrophica bacterium]|nr:3-hydroxyacyl-ACP dehydratase FabZ [Candidatus Omnitrophota bacterium]
MIFDLELIKSILPQREPFLFIDEVSQTSGAEKVVASKFIDPKEAYFKGHFPDNPVMPGVLIVEAMAQASIILYYLNKPEIAKKHPSYYLGKVKTEFLAPVFPGDTLILESVPVKMIESAAVVDALARVGEKIVAKAGFIFGVKKNE